MNISVVLPIFNEEEYVRNIVYSVLRLIGPLCTKLEIIAVNDGSVDKSLTILHSLAKKEKKLVVVNHGRNIGYGAVLRTGIKRAKYEWIYFTDVDMQFNLKELCMFLPYTNTHDFVVGYRKNRADNIRRRIISFFYNRFIRILFQIPLRDIDCAFKLMRTNAAKNILLTSNSFFISVELMVKAKRKGYKIKELAVAHYPRIHGISKVTNGRIIQTIKDLIRLYFE